MKLIALLAGALVLLGVAGLALASARSKRPDLGLRDGRLAPCPPTPNCVCSEGVAAGDGEHAIESLRFSGPAAQAWQRARAALAAMPRTVIDADTGSYLHAECTSALFRFVDDVELRLDAAAGVIQVRSASRAGRSDFGVNRRRVEALRAAF